jgi:Spy/CpxP family protein refolding chaperone
MNASRISYWAMWDGSGASTSMQSFVFNDDFRQGLGLTDEQHEQLKFMYSKDGTMGHWYRTKAQTSPELAALLEESDRLRAYRQNDFYGEKLTEEEKWAIFANSDKLTAFYCAETQKDIDNLLKPEQKRIVKESELAMLGEMGILNPSMFECLDLTQEQKTQMEAIKKELEPEFGNIVEELVLAEDALQQYKFDLFEKVGIKFDEDGNVVDKNGKPVENDPEAMGRIMSLMEEEILGNVEMRTKMKLFNERASGFMQGFKFKMFDVLTDAQFAKMQRIIDNPPEYVKKRRNEMQKQRAELEKDKNNEWMPGPNSWRPGDPIPEEYLKQRQQRNATGRFPSSDE